MTLFYFDTSGILKRYKSEKGSEFIDEFIEQRKPGETFFSSLLTALEISSVLSRLLKGRALTLREYDGITARFRVDFASQFQVGAVDNALVVSAITIAINRRLRTADAIHMAAIQRARQIIAGTEPVIVVTSDNEMIDVCHLEGIEVLNPEGDGASEELRRLRTGVQP